MTTSTHTPAVATPKPRDVWHTLRQWSRNYTLRAVLQGIVTVFAVTTFTFFLIRQMPGNPVQIKIDQLMQTQNLTYEQARSIAMGIFLYDPETPIVTQYLTYMSQLLQGNLGQSVVSAGTPVASQILRYLPWTLFSVGLALTISFTLGILIGLAMGYWRGSWFDNVVTVFASTVSGIPDYIIALLFILILGVQLQWFNVGEFRGGVDPTIEVGFTLEYLASLLKYAFFPVLIYVLSTVGTWILAMKSSTISTLGEDYITVAQARGLSERRVLTSYIGRNAMLPLVTRLAISIGFVVGGSIIIEEIFQYPGLGRALLRAVNGRDYTTMQGIFLVITSTVVLSNLFSDLALAWLDPRVRLGEGGKGK
jgi:peptide/nickel transport system permease protein